MNYRSKLNMKISYKRNKNCRSNTKIEIMDDNQAPAIVNSLESIDDKTLYKFLCKLDLYTFKKDGLKELTILQESNLLNKLIPMVDKNHLIKSTSLKLIVKLTKLDGIIDQLRKNQEFVDFLTYLFVENDELEILQHITYLLSRLCKSQKCALSLCCEDIIEKLFEILIVQSDASLMLNTIKIIQRIINREKLRPYLYNSQYFKLEIFSDFLENNFVVLRSPVIKIIYSISTWNVPKIHDYMYSCDTLSYLFKVLSDPYWTEMQRTCIKIIENSLRHHPDQTKMIESEEFRYFVNYAFKESKEHAFASLKIIGDLLKYDINREALILKRIYKVLPEYSKTGFDDMSVLLYQVMGNVCKSMTVAKELASENVITGISKFVSNTDLPWNPDRQTGLGPLCGILNFKPGLGSMFFRNNLFKQLREAIIKPKDLEEFYYFMALQIFQILQKNKSFHSYLWNKEVYLQMVNLLKNNKTEFVTTTLNIIQSSLYQCQYRQWLIELNGIETIVSLTTNKQNSEILNEMIIFIESASKYRDVAKQLQRYGLVPVINQIAYYEPKLLSSSLNIVNDIYKSDLSMKFFYTDFLDITDVTQNDFSAYVGTKPDNFPPKEITSMSSLPHSFTIITLNEIKQRKHHSNFSKYRSKYSKYNKPNLDYDPGVSTLLKVYVKKLTKSIGRQRDIIEKIKTLAKFVSVNLSNSDGTLCTEEQCNAVVKDLKLKLHSNYIPLGQLQIGRKVERAILFKVLADRLNIPCNLCRKNDNIAWNEIFIILKHPEEIFNKFVVDLFHNVGELLPIGHQDACEYCGLLNLRENV